MLSQMQQEHAAQQDAFAERKRQALAEHATRVRELKAVVVELELKLDQRKHEVSSFADVVVCVSDHRV